MGEVQKKSKVNLHNFMWLVLAYTCGGMMFTILFAPRIEKMEMKINRLDSTMQARIPIADSAKADRRLTLRKEDTIIKLLKDIK